MKHLRNLLFFLLLSTVAVSQPYVTVLTCAPGTDIHAHFGHTAIRYVDSASNIDIVYNYGIFSYSDDFAYNFVKGETYYRLGVTSYSRFLTEYYFDARSVVEQKLNLTPDEVFRMHAFLEHNNLPENREYLYNFFYDNCSSKPRDIIMEILGNSLIWTVPQRSEGFADSLWFASASQHFYNGFTSTSWRDLLHEYVSAGSWLRFGISLGLGRPADMPVSMHGSMFLPDFLCLALQYAHVVRDDTESPLVSHTYYVLHFDEDKLSLYESNPSALLWIVALLFLGIAYVEYRLKKHFYWLDSILFFIYSLVGIFVWYVSLISIHPAVFPNSNVLWTMPLHIVFALMWLIPMFRTYLRWYLLLTAVLLILYSVLAVIGFQYTHAGYIALIVILASRIVLLKHQGLLNNKTR